MIHQARPAPAHLAGQEGVRFSINQILSPASESSTLEEENQGYSYAPPGHPGGRHPSYPDSEQFNGYFYPKFENYFGEKWNGPHYPGRVSNTSLYYHDYGGRTSNGYQHDVTAGLKFPQSKPCEFKPTIAENSPLRNHDDMASSAQLGESPERSYGGFPNSEYPLREGLCHQAEPSKSTDSGYPGVASKTYGSCWDSILSRGGAATSCGGDSLTSGTSYSSQLLNTSSTMTSSGGGSLFGISPHSGLHRSPLLSGNFPWMESRRERIARECFVLPLFRFALSSNSDSGWFQQKYDSEIPSSETDWCGFAQVPRISIKNEKCLTLFAFNLQ